MIDYTKAAFKTIENDLKLFDFLFNIAFQVLYLAYLIYAIVVDAGFFIANIILLSFALVYFSFDLFARYKIAVVYSTDDVKKGFFYKLPVFKKIIDIREKRHDKKVAKQIKQRRKSFKKLFRRVNLLTKAVTLCLILYGVYTMTTHFTPISIISITIVIIVWLLQVIIEVAAFYVEKRFALIMEALKADRDNFVQPVVTVGNVIKKIVTGKEAEEQAKTKERKFLEKMVSKK
ncbi:MAG: hypothetical protein IJV77_02365 [Clostridia bacterium]|nr:hypothetical protein [Clostridia bacterium]